MTNDEKEVIDGLENIINRVPIRRWNLDINGPYEITKGPNQGRLSSPEYIFTSMYRTYKVKLEGVQVSPYHFDRTMFVGIKLSIHQKGRHLLDEENLEDYPYRNLDKVRELFKKLYLKYSDYHDKIEEARNKKEAAALKRKELKRRQNLNSFLKSFDKI